MGISLSESIITKKTDQALAGWRLARWAHEASDAQAAQLLGHLISQLQEDLPASQALAAAFDLCQSSPVMDGWEASQARAQLAHLALELQEEQGPRQALAAAGIHWQRSRTEAAA